METLDPRKSSVTRAAEALEWKRFLRFAVDEARSAPGKALIMNLEDPTRWAGDQAAANHLQRETQEASGLLTREALWSPLQDLDEPAGVLERLEKGGVLEVTELAFLRRWLYAIDSWAQVPREEVQGDLFRKALQALPDPYDPLRALDRVLTPEGELSERASPKLAALYGEIRALKREIGIVLDHLLKTFSQKGVLQENFSDVRDGRYVLPVKISNQNDVDGIIYEASASRQTVFVEPAQISPLNNRLRQRQNDLIQEIFVVLQETSKRILPYAGEIGAAVAIIAHWDAVQARARAGLHYGGKPIEVTADRTFLLPSTAHPLLWRSLPLEAIIRNHVDFGEPARSFLLTGPNTGGKTVLLKTLGLAGICARTGFPFPGSDHLKVPFFDRFFADLGDPQSIEEHLSSFSGHILRFKEILDGVTERSLVLIDELNSATDPEEGAALGRAFLETLMSKGAIIVSTTHDPHLKALAVSDPRIVNACMEFDESSRTPTYRLVLGVPGRSRALETAARLGIPEPVLELARSYLSQEHLHFEQLLSKLESDVAEAARSRRQAVAAREEGERLRKEWTERTETGVAELLDKTRQKLRRVVEQAQDEVRLTVRKLGEAQSRREAEVTRARLHESFSESSSRIDSALREEAPDIAEVLAARAQAVPEPPKERPLQPGTTVRVPKWKSVGTVLDVSGSKVKVALGNLQITVTAADVEAVSEQSTEAQTLKRQAARKASVEAPPAPAPQLDLRGQRLDEAMAELERYLDVAYRSGAFSEVTIIHGLGSGALREGARKILKSLPYIKVYRDGGVGAGGAGATIVEFER